MPEIPQPANPQHKTTQGVVHAVPCPWCGHKNDFRVLADAESGSSKDRSVSGWGSQGMETGAKVDCDHCGGFSKILAIEQLTVVKLVPTR